jgi:hypothetical protein
MALKHFSVAEMASEHKRRQPVFLKLTKITETND